MLSERYREQIKSLDKNLQDSELILEASELENLHEELTNLFSQKLNQVERRLNELTVKLDSVKSFNKSSTFSNPPIITKRLTSLITNRVMNWRMRTVIKSASAPCTTRTQFLVSSENI